MAEVSLIEVANSSALYSPRDYDPGRFDLNVCCNDARQAVIDKNRGSLMMSINDKLHYHSDSPRSALHIVDVIVKPQDRETVQIQVAAYFYQNDHNNIPNIINVVLKPAIENLLKINDVDVLKTSYYNGIRVNIKKHRCKMILTVTFERPGNKKDLKASCGSLSETLDSDAVRCFITHCSSLMPDCLLAATSYPVVNVTVDHIHTGDETSKVITGEIKAVKDYQVILYKHDHQEDPVDITLLKKEVQERVIKKVGEKMKTTA